jgi:HD superfamily phosphodiesterase
MSRLDELRDKIDELLLKYPDETWRRNAYVHLYGVSQWAALLALKRDLSPDIASAMGMLHDISAYTSGSYENHDAKGSEMAREILSGIKGYSHDEIETIATAIFRHDKIQECHSPYDEVLKDADIMQPAIYDITKPFSPLALPRRQALLKEFNAEL